MPGAEPQTPEPRAARLNMGVSVLRAGLLAGCEIALAGAPTAADTAAPALERLGARVHRHPHPHTDTDAPPVKALVFDARPAFGDGGRAGMNAALDGCWSAVSVVAPQLIERDAPGKLVFIAPPPDAGDHAPAARAGLENLARTLSIEWARYGITSVAILPGPATRPQHLDELIAFLLSPAGEYFSGCRLELR